MKNLSKYKIVLLVFILFIFFISRSSASVNTPVLEYDNGMVSCSSNGISIISFLENLADISHIEIYVSTKLQDTVLPVDFQQLPVMEAVSRLLKGYSFALIYSGNSQGSGKVYLYDKRNREFGDTGSSLSSSKSMAADKRAMSSENEVPEGFDQKETSSNRKYMVVSGNSTPNNFIRGGRNEGSKKSTASERHVDQDSYGNVSANSNNTSIISESQNSSKALSTEEIDPVQSGNTQSDDSQLLQSAGDYGYDSSDQMAQREAALINKIRELENDIESGEADQFYDFWTQKKDPKFIYNHWDDLDRCKQELSRIQGS